MKHLILFAGHLAALKTTLSKQIAQDLHIPVFNKDDVKEILGDHVSYSNREENLRLSHATFDLLRYQAKAVLKHHPVVILESNFKKDELDVIEADALKHQWQLHLIFMTGQKEELYARYLKRDQNRHQVHKSTGIISKDVFERIMDDYTASLSHLTFYQVDTTHMQEDIYLKLKAHISSCLRDEKKHNQLRLITPDPKYLTSYRQAVLEHQDEVLTYQFSNPDQEDIFQKFENYRLGINLPPLYVKQSYFWLVDDQAFIGEIGIRHHLTESLTTFGGHIGYGIRYSMRHKGYGTLMLKLGLIEARKLGIQKVLITCNDTNIGSARVIEKNGGILWDKITLTIDGHTRLTRRYWIEATEGTHETDQT